MSSAADVFGRLGFAEARVEDVLAAAKVSRPTYYRFFKNKEEIFDAAGELAMVALVNEITSLASHARNPINRLELAVEGYFRWLAKTGPFALTLLEQSMRAGSPQAPRRENTVRTLTEWLAAEVGQYRSTEYDPILFVALISCVEQIGLQLMRENARIGEKQIQRGKAIALRIAYAALSNPGDKLPPIPLRSA